MDKKKLFIIIGIALAIILIIVLAVSTNSEETTGSPSKEKQPIEPVELIEPDKQYAEELEEYDNNFVAQNIEMFYGDWQTTSDHAEYLFGNIYLTINEDGTWSGTIAETPLDGKWKAKGLGLYCKCDLIDFTLTFTDSGALLYQEEGKGVAVLTR